MTPAPAQTNASMNAVMSFLGLRVPPKYEDIGKEVKDLFERNYNFGAVRMNVKSINGVGGSALNMESVTEAATGKAIGFVEFANVFDADLLIQNKWTSENTFMSEITVVNRIQKGTKFSFIPTFDPKAGKLGGALAAQFNNDFISTRVEAAMEEGRPVITPSFVGSSDGWLIGTKFCIDPQTNKIDKKCASIGYQGGNFSAFGILNEKGEMFATLYQRLIEANAEAGFSVQLPVGGNDKTKLEFATAYNFDSYHRIQTKVNTQCEIGLAFAKNVGNGILLSISGQLDGKNIKQGAHKVGLGVEMHF